MLGEFCYQLQQNCVWEDLTNLSQRAIGIVEKTPIDDMSEPMSPFMFLALADTSTTAEQQLPERWHTLGAYPRNPIAQVGDQIGPVRSRRMPPKITLGYLSADFHAHATAYLIAELFERHDRDRFSVIGYSYGPDDGSAARQRFADGVDRFVDLRQASYVATTEQIAADGVDILIDLKGYTQNARAQILALTSCAPLGSTTWDIRGRWERPSSITSSWTILSIASRGTNRILTERLVHLPGCYQINDSRREIASRTPTRQECGLPESGSVFCGFHTSYKITPELFDVWMSLLKEAPGSVLWLLERNIVASENLRRARRSCAEWPPRDWCSVRVCPCPSIWRGIVWPTCSLTRSP